VPAPAAASVKKGKDGMGEGATDSQPVQRRHLNRGTLKTSKPVAREKSGRGALREKSQHFTRLVGSQRASNADGEQKLVKVQSQPGKRTRKSDDYVVTIHGPEGRGRKKKNEQEFPESPEGR